MAPVHDDYGKRVVREAAGASNVDTNKTLSFPGRRKNVDAVIDSSILCEIEARNYSQIPAAYAEFAQMDAAKKLFLVMSANLGGERSAAQLCERLRQHGEPKGHLIIVLLKGSGHNEQLETDVARVRAALVELSLLCGFGTDSDPSEQPASRDGQTVS
jgi:hypothetical protein